MNRPKAGLQPNQIKKGATEAAPFVSKYCPKFPCLEHNQERVNHGWDIKKEAKDDINQQ
ncbi:hypothetical protein QEH52_01515 [Coraliomargarita sp. SDUM461003]|uniref:Uncharacterized protein n=1 Tax=Thalassobacterium maritimum TaxID=3041265 RepID=A0ABU1ASE1_9BACT|nr:hypothetical protein [Coraliomargarita sp. SDUM461003]